jgi:hypothetical protein
VQRLFPGHRAYGWSHRLKRSSARRTLTGVDPLSVLLLAAILLGWIGLFALWWFGFRGRG